MFALLHPLAIILAVAVGFCPLLVVASVGEGSLIVVGSALVVVVLLGSRLVDLDVLQLVVVVVHLVAGAQHVAFHAVVVAVVVDLLRSSVVDRDALQLVVVVMQVIWHVLALVDADVLVAPVAVFVLRVTTAGLDGGRHFGEGELVPAGIAVVAVVVVLLRCRLVDHDALQLVVGVVHLVAAALHVAFLAVVVDVVVVLFRSSVVDHDTLQLMGIVMQVVRHIVVLLNFAAAGTCDNVALLQPPLEDRGVLRCKEGGLSSKSCSAS